MRLARSSILITIIILAGMPSPLAATDCDVETIVRIDDDVPDVTVLTKDGESVPLSDLIDGFVVPLRLEPGIYKVEVRRKSPNVYEVRGRDMLIRTRYCYEYPYGEEAILDIDRRSGFTIGRLIFD